MLQTGAQRAVFLQDDSPGDGLRGLPFSLAVLAPSVALHWSLPHGLSEGHILAGDRNGSVQGVVEEKTQVPKGKSENIALYNQITLSKTMTFYSFHCMLTSHHVDDTLDIATVVATWGKILEGLGMSGAIWRH